MPCSREEKLKAKAEAGDELEVVARLGRDSEAGVCDEKGLRVARAEADDCVAEVEAREDSVRGVEFQDAAHVRREVRPAILPLAPSPHARGRIPRRRPRP